MSVTLQIELPDDVYRALLPAAEAQGVQARHLVEAAVTRSVRIESAPSVVRAGERRARRAARAKRIAAFHARGWSDREIGTEIGLSHVHVGKIRREVLNLPPNHARFGEVLA